MPEMISTPGVLALWAAIGYLLGSVPSGVILARALNLGDLRTIGSGNIGATNVLRTGNKKAAALTLLFDALKGAIVVLLARALAGEDAAQLGALMAFLGHCFPIWLRFRGGKGVATYLGILWALAPLLGAIACLIWALTAAISRYSSLAALMAAGWTPVAAIFLGQANTAALLAVLCLFVYVRHWQNIARLKKGEESKIGASSQPKAPD